MSFITSLKKVKATSITLRLFLVAALVLSIFAFAIQPASAAGSAVITQYRYFTPPSAVLNLGTDTEFFWWKAEYATTPIKIVHDIINPLGTNVESVTYLAGSAGLPGSGTPGAGTPAYNPEDPTGAHQGDTATSGWESFANAWPVPVGSVPGTYHSIVSFYSAEVGGFETSSDVTFFVRQPLQIFKYHDLNGNGNNDGATDPGLDGWNFTVSGPDGAFGHAVVAGSPAPTTLTFTGLAVTSGFPAAGSHLKVNGVDVGNYTLVGDNFTLTGMPMGAPPTLGQTIALGYFSGVTSGGGFLTLPDLLAGGSYTVTETLQAGWTNTDPAGGPPVQKIINVPGGINESDPTVYFGNLQLTPGTILTMSASPSAIPSGGGTTALTIHEFNNGNLALHNVFVAVTGTAAAPYNSFTLTQAGPNPASTSFASSGNSDAILDIGETWTWVIPNVPISAATHFAAAGDGLDPSNNHVSPTSNPAYPSEAATVDVSVTPPNVPASSNPGLWLLIAAFAGTIAFFVYRRSARAQR